MTNIGLISENDNSTVLAEYKGLNSVATSFQSEDALEKELIKTLVEQGYERLNINSEDELILNLRKQLEKLNNYHFTDGEWDDFFTKVIANKNDYIIEKTRLIQEDYKQPLRLENGELINVYLIDKDNNLSIINTSNQDTPYYYGFTPIMTIDVWEHSYYLKHYNKRKDYLEDIFNIIDYDKVYNIYKSSITT